MSLGRFCPLAVVGERLGLLGTKPPVQFGVLCVEALGTVPMTGRWLL